MERKSYDNSYDHVFKKRCYIRMTCPCEERTLIARQMHDHHVTQEIGKQTAQLSTGLIQQLLVSVTLTSYG